METNTTRGRWRHEDGGRYGVKASASARPPSSHTSAGRGGHAAHVQVEDGAGGLSLEVARQLQLSEGLGFRSFAGA